MGEYVRIGNRTLLAQDVKSLSQKQIEEIKADGERANQKRLENLRASMGIKLDAPLTLDVTPAGIAARKAAIAVEEAKLAAETKAITESLGPEKASFVAEAEAPTEVKIKKSKKKAVEIASSNLTT